MCLAGIDRRLIDARSTEIGLREAASLCTKGHEGIKARLIQGADQISTLIGMIESANFVAQLNHDTIKGMRA